MTTTDVYRALWRHKLFVIVLTVCLVAATWYVTSRQEPVYEASTLVRIQQRIEDPGQTLGILTAGAQLAETYAEIVRTSSVNAAIYSRLDGRVSFEEIFVSAEPVQGLDLLWISARSVSPEQARAVANAAPEALERFIRTTGTLRDQVITVQRAKLPQAPVSPNLKLNLAVAVLLGIIFNAALALVLELFGDRIADSEELERIAGYPVLAVVPNLRFSPLAPLEYRHTEPLPTKLPKKAANA